MKISIIKDCITRNCGDADIIVLKGFPINDILKLTTEYTLVDEAIIEKGKINLRRINTMSLISELIKSSDKKYLITYESFLDLTYTVRNLSAFNKKIYILTNNILQTYVNPTTENIPDFDSQDFQENFSVNPYYAKYYSFCMHIDGYQYVQYIGYYIDNEDEIRNIELFVPTPLKISDSLPDGSYITLSRDNGTLDKLMEDIYFCRHLSSTCFIVDEKDITLKEFGVLQSVSDTLKLGLQFFKADSNLTVSVRPELCELMENTWGYKSFRDLKMYTNLNKDKSVTTISQGEIIETVVSEAEKALTNNGKGTKNVLLTSPTGAGKSLLFQLASIYLANKYKSLSIIVSPLVALMNDQVDNLVGNYKAVATLNGNIPVNEKEDIIQKVKDGDINILYLAPELLLSYSISSFIGERKIGLFVVDEAHTVTTWGRDFRVDYWFLGDYIRQSKRILGYSFPIFALTATAVWDPTGKNDMVFDIIASLNMDPCIKYIGVVRRDDIHFQISTSNISTNYEHNRNLLTIQRIHESITKKKKTIVYFPFKSTIRKLFNYSEMNDVIDKVTEYHSSLNPSEKALNAEGFKSGEKLVMCATKAYGMGIDVSDINMVYHHAPTGCLSDYVQEIGRVARDPSIDGVAKIDFSEHDFRFTRTLHGLSTIKSYQLMAVLMKLMALYKMNGEKRNMLISSTDFSYIFSGKDVDYDQKLKSCLLLISHDLQNKLRFNAIIVRPKNLFSKAYLSVSKAQIPNFEQKYYKFIHKVDEGSSTYKVDIDKIWTLLYSQYSFPNFKRKLAEGTIFTGFDVTIKNKVIINLTLSSVTVVRNYIDDFFKNAHKFLALMSMEHRRITFQEMKNSLSNYSEVRKEEFIETFKMVYATDFLDTSSDFKSYCRVYPLQGAVQLTGQGYERNHVLYMSAFDKNIVSMKNIFYCSPYSHVIRLAELLNSLNVADYERLGGDKPAIFVRINNPVYLNDLVRRGHYSNAILNAIYDKFKFSEWVFNFFFTTPMSDYQRWNFIEAYFLGASKEELLALGKG